MTAIGWSAPRTPSGRFALVCPPPWHVSGELIAIDFTADPAQVTGFLPAGVQPDPAGAASVVFGQWCATADHDPRLGADPARSQYTEAFLVLHGRYRDRPVGVVPFIWVDSDTSLARGWLQGFPKVFGDIAMTRAIEVGRGGVRKEIGATFHAHVSEYGRRLCTASVQLAHEEPGTLPKAVSTPLLLNRIFPSLDGTGTVDRLVHNRVADVEVGRVLTGAATLDIGGGDHEIGLLAPTGQPSTGAVFPYAFSIVGSTCVEDLTTSRRTT